MNRRVALLVTALVATASLAGAVEKPAWTEGDTWTYTVPVDGGEPPRTTVNVTSTDGGEVVLVSTTVKSQSTTPAPGLPPVTSSETTKVTTTYDAATGAVKSVVTERSSTAGGLSTSTNVQTVTVTYDPPCPVTAWPVTLNKTWSVDCAFTSQTSTPGAQPTTGTYKADFAVKARENVTVPAGTFVAYKIVNVTGGQDRDAVWFAPEACGTVKTADASGKTTSQLADFACASPGVDDYVPPPPEEDEEPPANETSPEEDPEEEPPQNESPPMQEPPAEEDEGFLGLPGPGALLVALGAAGAAVAFRRSGTR